MPTPPVPANVVTVIEFYAEEGEVIIMKTLMALLMMTGVAWGGHLPPKVGGYKVGVCRVFINNPNEGGYVEAQRIPNDPHMSDSNVKIMEDGADISILKKSKNWFFVEMNDDDTAPRRSGWIPARNIICGTHG
jgi:hypothetical protein